MVEWGNCVSRVMCIEPVMGNLNLLLLVGLSTWIIFPVIQNVL